MLRERKLRKDIKDIICKRIPPAAVLARKCVHSIMQSNRHAVPFTLPALGQVRAQACRETHLQTRRLIQIECTIDKCICVLYGPSTATTGRLEKSVRLRWRTVLWHTALITSEHTNLMQSFQNASNLIEIGFRDQKIRLKLILVI